MDQNLLMLGGLALAASLGLLIWSKRQPVQASSQQPERTAKDHGRDGKLPAAASKPQRPPPAPRPLADDEDLEITLVTTYPVAELVRAARAANAGEIIKLGDSDGATPEITARAAGAELEEQRASHVKLSFEAEAETEEVTSPIIRILISAAGDSDQGRLRKRNEDSLLVLPERSLYVIADGMGGHAGGEVASALAVDVLRDSFERQVFEAETESSGALPRRGRELACAIQMANQAIHALGTSDPALHNMGTTVVAARFSPNKQRVYIGHVGDSRCYRLRGTEFRQLTQDHTMSTFGVKGPRGNDLYQAVGVQPTLSIDLIVDKPRENDLYLLCSDGLSKMVNDEDVRAVLLKEPDLEAAVYALLELANDHGGRDNTSLILVKVVERPLKAALLNV